MQSEPGPPRFAMARVKQDLRTKVDAYGLTKHIGENR
jgi:hypothetical protein